MWGGRGGRGACACGGGGGGGGGVILGEVKARPKDIISFSLDYISKKAKYRQAIRHQAPFH